MEHVKTSPVSFSLINPTLINTIPRMYNNVSDSKNLNHSGQRELGAICQTAGVQV